MKALLGGAAFAALLLCSTALGQGAIQQQMDRIYEEEIQKALLYSPSDKTRYQLRGDAQARAQELFDVLAKEHGYPPFKVGGIVFLPILRSSETTSIGAAGMASDCDMPPFTMYLNEILFYRNYQAFMDEVIPHEVAHIVACLKPTYGDGGSHGADWETAMRAMGIPNPHNETRHNLDTTPIENYRDRINMLLMAAIR